MPAGSRIRANNVIGTITDNPLTTGAVGFNSPLLTLLPTVAGDHAVLTLDPLRQFGNPEIVIVTAHSAASTTATITRGAYGTSARAHPQGTVWIHAPMNEDVVPILTSSTRPSDPYRGEMIFETDTNTFTARDTSDAWQAVVTLGAWISYTPSFVNFTLGNGTLVSSYIRMGRTILFRTTIILGTTSVMGTDPNISLPVACAAYNTHTPIGQVNILDASAADFQGTLWAGSSTFGRIITWSANGSYVTGAVVSPTVPMTWTNPDGLMITGFYEAAS